MLVVDRFPFSVYFLKEIVLVLVLTSQMLVVLLLFTAVAQLAIVATGEVSEIGMHRL